MTRGELLSGPDPLGNATRLSRTGLTCEPHFSAAATSHVTAMRGARVQKPSFARTRSFTTRGSALPPVSFIT
jgi:hypothetical protein